MTKNLLVSRAQDAAFATGKADQDAASTFQSVMLPIIQEAAQAWHKDDKLYKPTRDAIQAAYIVGRLAKDKDLRENNMELIDFNGRKSQAQFDLASKLIAKKKLTDKNKAGENGVMTKVEHDLYRGAVFFWNTTCLKKNEIEAPKSKKRTPSAAAQKKANAKKAAAKVKKQVETLKDSFNATTARKLASNEVTPSQALANVEAALAMLTTASRAFASVPQIAHISRHIVEMNKQWEADKAEAKEKAAKRKASKK